MGSNERFMSSGEGIERAQSYEVSIEEERSLLHPLRSEESVPIAGTYLSSGDAIIVKTESPGTQASPAEVLVTLNNMRSERFSGEAEISKVPNSLHPFDLPNDEHLQPLGNSHVEESEKDDVDEQKRAHGIRSSATRQHYQLSRETQASDRESSPQRDEDSPVEQKEVRGSQVSSFAMVDDGSDGLKPHSLSTRQGLEHTKYHAKHGSQTRKADGSPATEGHTNPEDVELAEDNGPSLSYPQTSPSVDIVVARTSESEARAEPMGVVSSKNPAPACPNLSTAELSSTQTAGAMKGERSSPRSSRGAKTTRCGGGGPLDVQYDASPASTEDEQRVHPVQHERDDISADSPVAVVTALDDEEIMRRRGSFAPAAGGPNIDVDRDEIMPQTAAWSEEEEGSFQFVDGAIRPCDLGETRNPAIVEPSGFPVLDAGGSVAYDEHAMPTPTGVRSVDAGGGGDDGCDPLSLSNPQGMIPSASVFSQAVHVLLAFVVLILVSFAKAGDGVPSTTYCRSAGVGGPGYSSRRSSKVGGDPKGEPRQRSSGLKRRRSGNYSGFGAHLSLLARRLRAVWSKLWHAAERDLATRWQAAGKALAALRQGWASLWLSRPHAEADVLAETLALASRSRHRGGADRGGRRRHANRGAKCGTAHRGLDVVAGLEEGLEDRFARGSGADLRRAVGAKFLGLCGYRPLPGLGRGKNSRSPKFLLVLDLDETLVHCSPRPFESSRRRSRRFAGEDRRVDPYPDLKVELRGGAPSDRPGCMFAWKRPHLDAFLRVVSRWYEIAVFTSGQRCFAEPLIDLLDPGFVIGKKFYRDSCIRRDGGHPRSGAKVQNSAGGVGGDGTGTAAPGARGAENVKDLSVIGSEHFPLRTVLVDNQPRTVVQQANVLPIKSWYPRDVEDCQLLDLLPVLLALTSCQDVRSVLSLRPGVVS